MESEATLRRDSRKANSTSTGVVRVGSLAEASALSSSYVWQLFRTAAPLALGDWIATVACIAATLQLANWVTPGADVALPVSPAGVGVLALLGMAWFELLPGAGVSPIVELRRIVWALSFTFGGVALTVVGGALPASQGLLAVAVGWPLAILAVWSSRVLLRGMFAESAWWGIDALLVGSGPSLVATWDALHANRTSGLRPMHSLAGETLLEAEALGATDADCRFPLAVVSVPERPRVDSSPVIALLARHCSRVIVLAPEGRSSPGSLWLTPAQCGELSGFALRDRMTSRWQRVLKRALDLALALLASLLVLPLVPLTALLVRLTSAGPIFYGQERIGRGRRAFKAWKFRTMMHDADRVLLHHLQRDPALREEWKRTHKLRRDPRVTAVGRVLRQTSLDELPQLWNVVRGEMSIVGPRPIVNEEVEKYGDDFEAYCRVSPGITGLWQVSGRSRTSYAERVALDAYYVRNWSIWLDFWVLLRTLPAVLRGTGAS